MAAVRLRVRDHRIMAAVSVQGHKGYAVCVPRHIMSFKWMDRSFISE